MTTAMPTTDVTAGAVKPVAPATNGITPPQPVATPEPPKPETTPEMKLLAKKEQEIQAERKKIQSDREVLKTQQAAFEKSFKDQLVQNPLKVLRDAGIDYNKITEQILAEQNPSNDPRIAALQQEIESIKAGIGETQNLLKTQQQTSYDNAIKQLTNDVATLVDTGTDFEAIKSLNAQKDVVDLIEKTFQSEGRLMTIKEAAQEVENYLVDQGLKFATIGKVKAKLAAPAPKTESVPAKPAVTTITHKTMATTSQPLSDKDRRSRAIAAFKGEPLA